MSSSLLIEKLPPKCPGIRRLLFGHRYPSKSSEGHIYGAHQTNLESFSGGFPIVGSVSVVDDEQGIEVQLAENTSTLKPMLQFMHSVAQPDLNVIKFADAVALAEVAEKYMIYSAVQLCKFFMRIHASGYPVDVFVYAIKHGHMDLARVAASNTVPTTSDPSFRPRYIGSSDLILTLLVRNFPPVRVYNFKRSHVGGLSQQVPRGMRTADDNIPCIMHKEGRQELPSCRRRQFQHTAVAHMKRNLEDMSRFSEVVNSHTSILCDCRHCNLRADKWARQVGGKFWDPPTF
ncbi:hypothetical protein B0H34DRAFT_738226 [Crassisporium funariophilum]|nr:hypothetical protein B0H34DRAFT_738226 [Crassisporium funariophilum]